MEFRYKGKEPDYHEGHRIEVTGSKKAPFWIYVRDELSEDQAKEFCDLLNKQVIGAGWISTKQKKQK